MITGGHIASSYLLAMGAKGLGISVSTSDILQIIIAGNIADIDFIYGMLINKTGEAHHQNVTHTPVGALLFFVGFWLFLTPSLDIAILILLSLFLHLILDDIGYWFYKIKFYKSKTNPQINWLFPFTQFHKEKLIEGNKEVLYFYLFKAWPVALLEIVLIVVALILLFSSLYSR
jgi:hypothetical protein